MTHCILTPVYNPFTGRLDMINSAKGAGSVAHPVVVLQKGIVTAVGTTTKTTILTLPASLVVQFITLVKISGHVYAKFFLTIDTDDDSIIRSGPDRTIEWDFGEGGFTVPIGSVVDVKVEHFVAGGSFTFESTIWGYT